MWGGIRWLCQEFAQSSLRFLLRKAQGPLVGGARFFRSSQSPAEIRPCSEMGPGTVVSQEIQNASVCLSETFQNDLSFGSSAFDVCMGAFEIVGCDGAEVLAERGADHAGIDQVSHLREQSVWRSCWAS